MASGCRLTWQGSLDRAGGIGWRSLRWNGLPQRAGSVTEPQLAALVEDIFGADVTVVDLGTDFDGLAASSEAAKLIVLATSQFPGRQRFTLAHELGHLLAGDDHGVHLDKDIFDRAQQKDPSEMRANAFAAAFLMPEAILRERVGRNGLTEAGFAELACDLLVSPSTLAYRLLTLRLIDNGTCDRFKSISGAKAASLAGRTSEWAQRVAEANAPRPPGLLVRDCVCGIRIWRHNAAPVCEPTRRGCRSPARSSGGRRRAVARAVTTYLFPDNTVLCNFACVGRLSLLRTVLNGRGRWTSAVAYEASRSARFIPSLNSIPWTAGSPNPLRSPAMQKSGGSTGSAVRSSAAPMRSRSSIWERPRLAS